MQPLASLHAISGGSPGREGSEQITKAEKWSDSPGDQVQSQTIESSCCFVRPIDLFWYQLSSISTKVERA